MKFSRCHQSESDRLGAGLPPGLVAGLLLGLVSGCATAGKGTGKVPGNAPPSPGAPVQAESAARSQPRAMEPADALKSPTHYPKWNPVWWFGNVDDPLPPDWYRPGDPHRLRDWRLRNPGHNFTFYVMGIGDKEFQRTGRHPHDVFNPEGGWNWAVCRYKWLRLPFVSYRASRFQFYLGWRERGNFGMKLAIPKEAARHQPPESPASDDLPMEP